MDRISIFSEDNLNVVVDDNDMIMEYLANKAKSRYSCGGGKVKFYQKPEVFLRDLSGFPENTNYFFGNYFGNRRTQLEGLDLAKAVKIRSKYSPVFLVTTIASACLAKALDEDLVDCVFPKEVYFTEPFDKLQLTDEEFNKIISIERVYTGDPDMQNFAVFKLQKRAQCLSQLQEAHDKLLLASMLAASKAEISLMRKSSYEFASLQLKSKQNPISGFWSKFLNLIRIESHATALQVNRSK